MSAAKQEQLDRLLVDTNQAAEMLGVSPRTVWTLKTEGRLPHVRIGRLIRFPVDQLRRWTEAEAIGGDQGDRA